MSEAAEQPPLVPERTIALKNVSGRIEYLAIDLGRKRLFMAELGNGTVDVIDLASASVSGRSPDGSAEWMPCQTHPARDRHIEGD